MFLDSHLPPVRNILDKDKYHSSPLEEYRPRHMRNITRQKANKSGTRFRRCRFGNLSYLS